jgi:hypothetical protein
MDRASRRGEEGGWQVPAFQNAKVKGWSIGAPRLNNKPTLKRRGAAWGGGSLPAPLSKDTKEKEIVGMGAGSSQSMQFI